MVEVRRLLRFEVLEHLGAGEGSTIYRVADPDEGRTHALKHVVRSTRRDIRFLKALGNEFRVGRTLLHPNLRRVYELKVTRSWAGRMAEAFLLMEYVQGQTLDADPPRSVADTIDAFLQIAQGMKAMHEMGHVHCDLKPTNVLRSRDGHVKIIDYGQSCPGGTLKEGIQGTPDFVAPEQLLRKPITIQTDIYSMGAMLYGCLTAKPVPTLLTVAKKGGTGFPVENRIETPQDLNPTIPLPLSNLVMDCISVRPQRRPADMDQVITRLELSRHLGPGDAGKLAILRPRGPKGLEGHARL